MENQYTKQESWESLFLRSSHSQAKFSSYACYHDFNKYSQYKYNLQFSHNPQLFCLFFCLYVMPIYRLFWAYPELSIFLCQHYSVVFKILTIKNFTCSFLTNENSAKSCETAVANFFLWYNDACDLRHLHFKTSFHTETTCR